MARDTSKKLSEVILQFMREEDLNVGLLQHRTVMLWSLLLGPTVNRVTRNVYMKEDVLIVELQSSVVRQELSMMKSKIISKFNAALGNEFVRDIVFR